MKKQIAIYLLLALIAAGAGFAFNYWRTLTPPQAELPQNALHFELPDYRGQVTYSLDDWRGQVIMLNFWATWCPPCRVEIPDFVRLQSELGERGLQVVGIALDRPEMVAEFASEVRFNYPSLIADRGGYGLLERYGNDRGTLPYTVFIDRSGNIVARHWQGILSYEDAKNIIEPLL